VYGEVTGAFSANQNTFSPKAMRKDVVGTGVTKYGKNLLPYPFYFANGETGKTTFTKDGITFTNNGDGSVTLNGTAEKQVNITLAASSNPIVLPKGVKVSLSGTPERVKKDTCFCVLRTADVTQSAKDYGQGASMVTEYQEYLCLIAVKAETTLENVTVRPQVEIGKVSAWEEYIAPSSYVAGADGKVVDVELPPKETTTLIAKTEGTAIRVVYNRDTNKVIEELVNAIISLGGNV